MSSVIKDINNEKNKLSKKFSSYNINIDKLGQIDESELEKKIIILIMLCFFSNNLLFIFQKKNYIIFILCFIIIQQLLNLFYLLNFTKILNLY